KSGSSTPRWKIRSVSIPVSVSWTAPVGCSVVVIPGWSQGAGSRAPRAGLMTLSCRWPVSGDPPDEAPDPGDPEAVRRYDAVSPPVEKERSAHRDYHEVT